MPETMITLWRDNKLANKWEASLEDLVQRFIESPYNKGDYLDWPPQRRMATWIGANDGLSSVMESEDFEKLLDAWAAIPAKDRYTKDSGAHVAKQS